MKERVAFIAEAIKVGRNMQDLCREFKISRKTGYKWFRRYRRQGDIGLVDRPSGARTFPHAISKEIGERIIAFKQKHRTWGPKKIIHRLKTLHPELRWPATSSAGELLKRHGMVNEKVFRRRPLYARPALQRPEHPNQVWAADFKGWFNTLDGERIDPLTISDLASRFVICCKGLRKTGFADVQPEFEAVFREFGLPQTIRTDNGPPFASQGLNGLSKLSVWWMRLGIFPERIRPGHPDDNGCHERMHETLKEDTASPPEASFQAQQEAFDRFCRVFNQERPHEALAMQTPSARYRPSLNPFPNRLKPHEYGPQHAVRSVRTNGAIKWDGETVYVNWSLVGERVGLIQIGESDWRMDLGQFPIAILDGRTLKLREIEKADPEKVLPSSPV